MKTVDRSFRRTRVFNRNEYVYFEHRFFENQAVNYLKELRDRGFTVRMTKGVIQINGKPHPYWEFWVLKTQYLKWKDDIDRRLYGKYYEHIINKRGYTGGYTGDDQAGCVRRRYTK